MRRGLAVVLGLGAAALFGASVPLTKGLAAAVDPLMLAALLYLGAGGAVALLRLGRAAPEPPLRASDAPWLLGTVVAGAIAGPALLVAGLRLVPGSAAALLLNLEAPLTAALAVAIFGEHLGRRGWTAAALLAAGAAVLAAPLGPLRVHPWGALCVVSACAAWAFDTNFMQRLSLRDPVALVRFKGLVGGACTLALALLAGERLPPARSAAIALAVGGLGYGASIVAHLRAMRELGAARQSALFAVAPFAGALWSVPILGERLGWREAIAAALMACGIALLARERHAHRHVHEPIEHEHLHAHDEHHRHEHEGPVVEPHSHPHRHERVEHTHPHVPDAHHRHRH